MSDRCSGPCHLEILTRCSPSGPCMLYLSGLPSSQSERGGSLESPSHPPPPGTGSLCPFLPESWGDTAFSREGRVDREEAAEYHPSHCLAGLPGGLRTQKSAQHQAKMRLLLLLPWAEKQVSGTRAGRGQGGRGENLLGAVDQGI